MHCYLRVLQVVQPLECLRCMKSHLPLCVAPFIPKGHVTHHTCMCDDVISGIITSQDDVMLQLAFEGALLMHLHKNVKNSVKSLV